MDDLGAIATQYSALLAEYSDELTLKRFIDSNLNLLGWRFSWGTSPTIVVPQFRLGSDYVVDYLVIDSPQWTDIYLIEIEDANERVFNQDGTYGKRLNQAIRQVSDWTLWVTEHREYFRDKVVEVVSEVEATHGRQDMNEGVAGGSFTGQLTASIRLGHWKLVTAIVAGRRHSYEGKEGKYRMGFLKMHAQVIQALFSFDALLDTCTQRWGSVN